MKTKELVEKSNKYIYVWVKGDLDWVKMNVRYGKGRYSNLQGKGE